jgi:hypothetical protein
MQGLLYNSKGLWASMKIKPIKLIFITKLQYIVRIIKTTLQYRYSS